MGWIIDTALWLKLAAIELVLIALAIAPLTQIRARKDIAPMAGISAVVLVVSVLGGLLLGFPRWPRLFF